LPCLLEILFGWDEIGNVKPKSECSFPTADELLTLTGSVKLLTLQLQKLFLWWWVISHLKSRRVFIPQMVMTS